MSCVFGVPGINRGTVANFGPNNEPGGFTPFINTTWTGSWPIDNWNTTDAVRDTIVSDATAPISPTHEVLRFDFDGLDGGNGAGTVYNDTNLNLKEYYFRAYFKYSSNFDEHPILTKHWYPFSTSQDFFCGLGGGGFPTLANSVSVQGVPTDTYNVNGSTVCPNGTWYKWELYFNGTSSANFVLKTWVNGIADISLVGTTRPGGSAPGNTWVDGWGGVEEWRYVTTWGGTGGTISGTGNYFYVDGIYLSKP